ncbi:hypothetical protein [Streptomyces microflavus]|uniref:Uncharacterized protein n=1 Tax=Streptomyces microflavus TaxID=1919 RepID=A0ABV1QCU9_STRMI
MSVFTLPLHQMPPAQQPAADMRDLAARVRALLSVRENRSSQISLGGQMFDVVVTAGGRPGRAAVVQMDEIQLGTCGPVIEDRGAQLLFWLVPPGTAATWGYHGFGLCVGAPYTLALPALGHSEPPGPYWLRPCISDRLVPPQRLRPLLYQAGPLPASPSAVQAHLSAAETLGLQEGVMSR